jgi:hypothetical protein
MLELELEFSQCVIGHRGSNDDVAFIRGGGLIIWRNDEHPRFLYAVSTNVTRGTKCSTKLTDVNRYEVPPPHLHACPVYSITVVEHLETFGIDTTCCTGV